MDAHDIAKTTALQLIRQAIRSCNLSRLKEGFERDWALEIIRNTDPKTSQTGEFMIFHEALKEMKKEERQKAFQWTWDCYHPLMSELAKALAELDGYSRQSF